MVQWNWLGLCASTDKGTGSIPGCGNKIPNTMPCSQKKKKKTGLNFEERVRSTR